MSDVLTGLIFLAAAAFAGSGLIIVVLAAICLDDWWRRRRRELRGMTDREVANATDPGEYGVDISVWPSRAPRNGSAHEDIA